MILAAWFRSPCAWVTWGRSRPKMLPIVNVFTWSPRRHLPPFLSLTLLEIGPARVSPAQNVPILGTFSPAGPLDGGTGYAVFGGETLGG